MKPLIPTLRKLPRPDLLDLLEMISPAAVVAHEEETDRTLSDRLVFELFQLCGLPPGEDALLERHLVSRLANALHIDYDPAMETAEISSRLDRHISDSVVDDLRPFIQVAVCVGWADGVLAPEEIAVMDAALSRLKLVARRRTELLSICSKRLDPQSLSGALADVGRDDQKAWSVLALGWAVALADMKTLPSEIDTFHQIAALLGIDRTRADSLRELVTRRFNDNLDDAGGRTGRFVPRALAKATMAAISAAELDSYLRAATGLKSLSLLVSSRVRISDHRDSVTALDAMLDTGSWIGAPALLAGALFLRRLGGDELSQQLLVVALTCLERAR